MVLMLENRSFDHMLGFLYEASGNVSPTGDPFEGRTKIEGTVNDLVRSRWKASRP
jgi:phospholipase C